MSRYSEFATLRESTPNTSREAMSFLGFAVFHIHTTSSLMSTKEWKARNEAVDVILKARNQIEQAA